MSSAYRIGTAAANMVTVLVETPEHQKSVQRGQRLAYGVEKKTCYQHGAVWREWKGWFWTAQTSADAFPSLTLAELKALYEQGRVWWADKTAAGSGSYSEDQCLGEDGCTTIEGKLELSGGLSATASVEACVEARNQGRELEKEGKDILTNAAKSSPELKAAMETWKEIKFEFDTVDKLDVVHR